MKTPDPEAGAPFADDVLTAKVRHVYRGPLDEYSVTLPPEAVEELLAWRRYARACDLPTKTGDEWYLRELLGDASYDDPWHDERPEVEPTE